MTSCKIRTEVVRFPGAMDNTMADGRERLASASTQSMTSPKAVSLQQDVPVFHDEPRIILIFVKQTLAG
jgi:hypothetical protein